MPDIIRLLSDSLANQIAAGEVIQRPASVVKELMENAVDAGGHKIQVIVKDAGRSLVQVIDDGGGMSGTDARMAFERHATSKICKTEDLFAIRTMGFRGEALASIAAVAEVSLKTRLSADELGTEILIAGSKVQAQEVISCPAGSNFMVQNLFFNIPARRKFLKSNTTEFKHIINEFQRVVMAHPDKEFLLIHNETEVYQLPVESLKQRIVRMFGRHYNQELIDIHSESSLIKISGYIGIPEAAKKSAGEQYFFINQRYMKHPYFHRAIQKAYDKLLPAEEVPVYFLWFETDPSCIDVNIHPTKTEIKFEDEQAIWQIIHAAVKQSLGKFNIVPSIDFDVEKSFEMPYVGKNTVIRPPVSTANPLYNPFDEEKTMGAGREYKDKNLQQWQLIYSGLENKSINDDIPHLFNNSENGALKIDQIESKRSFLQIKNKYILLPVKSGIMIIDQHRAHQRILYEKIYHDLNDQHFVSQKNLFPERIELAADDFLLISEVLPVVNSVGFEIDSLGGNSLVVNAYPAFLEHADTREVVYRILEDMKQHPDLYVNKLKEQLAVVMADSYAIPYGKPLGESEILMLVDGLFACSNHNYAPSGKAIMHILELQDIEKILK